MNAIYSKIYEKQVTGHACPSCYGTACIVVTFFTCTSFKFRCALKAFLLTCICTVCAYTSAPAQIVAVKTNLLYNAAVIPSLGTEVALPGRYTLNVAGTYCPISYGGDRKWKNWSVQPELRRWLCTPFSGYFIGAGAIKGGFNIGRVPFFGLSGKRAQGTFYGGCLTAGFHQILSPHWGLECSVCAGMLHISYSRYRPGHYGYRERASSFNYTGPTGAGIVLVYMLR